VLYSVGSYDAGARQSGDSATAKPRLLPNFINQPLEGGLQ
jgi:hypothetical protein